MTARAPGTVMGGVASTRSKAAHPLSLVSSSPASRKAA
jgi:hypothetical protein